ncbi:hypothetical protein KO491_12890 [Roseovarius nubinhibens]|uniref:CFI-box-CTERM domain-containing protein n=1 Tax=Roseovarius nubinhibens TaxID=314263 RepID=UPI001C08310A|nr:CFI-box-CTERM domain-containing protein [Roseovarius nubinhibens]MBU3000735.1 hypothetical protein [Roseovarius nubinhibens]
MPHLTRRRLLGTLSATGLTTPARPLFAQSYDAPSCKAQLSHGDWVIKTQFVARYANDSFIGYESQTTGEHRPTGLRFGLHQHDDDAEMKKLRDAGKSGGLHLPDHHYLELFTPDHQGDTPRRVRTYMTIVDPDSDQSASIVMRFTPMALCKNDYQDDAYAWQLARLTEGACVLKTHPQRLPRLHPTNPSTQGWHPERETEMPDVLRTQHILMSAENRVQLRFGYRDEAAGKWTRLREIEIDTNDLYGAVNRAYDMVYDQIEASGNGDPATCRKDSDCFLTTACCAEMGRPDECTELTTLRRFRDGWLRAQPQGAALIAEYYDSAPAICAALARDPRGAARLRALYWATILPCVAAIRLGANRLAFRLYCRMMRRLMRAYPEATT